MNNHGGEKTKDERIAHANDEISYVVIKGEKVKNL